MKKHDVATRLLFLWIICLGLAGLTGCASHTRQPATAMDTPEHHVFNGMKLLEEGRLDEAEKNFSLALELEPEHSRAHFGLGLVQGQNREFAAGFTSMKKAVTTAGDSREKALAHTGYMRLFLLEQADGWLDNVTVHYEKAVVYDKDLPDPRYYMGLAYKEAKQYERAVREFEKVLTIDKALVKEADRELAHCQKVLRAMPGNVIGKNLAGEATITRADTAAILIHELEVDQLYARHGLTPEPRAAYPWDIRNHPLKAAVTSVLDMNLAGLHPFPGNEFKPDEPVTRAGFAMIIADIIATLSRDAGLRTRFIGQTTPYTDVAEDAPFFNAVMVCATRGIMGPPDVLGHEFTPMGPVSGAEALLIIRHLKKKLTLH